MISPSHIQHIQLMIMLGYDIADVKKSIVREIIYINVLYFIIFGPDQYKVISGKTKLLL